MVMVVVTMTVLMIAVSVMADPCPGKARGGDLTTWGFVAERG